MKTAPTILLVIIALVIWSVLPALSYSIAIDYSIGEEANAAEGIAASGFILVSIFFITIIGVCSIFFKNISFHKYSAAFSLIFSLFGIYFGL